MTDSPKLTIVVLSCGELGIAVANSLRALPTVGRIFLVTAPYRRHSRTLRAKLRQIYRTQGLPGFISVAAGKARALLNRGGTGENCQSTVAAVLAPEVERLDVRAFEDPDALDAIRTRKPDLGVIAGTYILPEKVFGIPRLGSINLHSGKVPEYRGAAPAFWELYNGEREVGVSIHQVARSLDAGPVLLQETFPLDPAPSGDPLRYIEVYRRDVLEPNGIRMLATAVNRIANGSIEAKPQDVRRSRTYKTPDYAAIRTLRARVRERRRAPTTAKGIAGRSI